MKDRIKWNNSFQKNNKKWKTVIHFFAYVLIGFSTSAYGNNLENNASNKCKECPENTDEKTKEAHSEESSKELFNLKDFNIETSWLTGEKDRRTESFDPSKVGDEPWYHKKGNRYVLKSLQTDGNRTEWKEKHGKESSLDTYKNLSYKAKVEGIPENGVTITQVHNRGGIKRPLLRLYIDKDNYMKIKVTKTTPTGKTSTYDRFKGPYYEEGTDFTVNLITNNGKIFITVKTTSGILKEEIIPTKEWKDFKDSYYLKAGVYTEGNNKKPKSTYEYFTLKKQ